MLNDFLPVPGGAIQVCHIVAIYAQDHALYARLTDGSPVFIGDVPDGRDPDFEAFALYNRLQHD